MGTHFRIIQQVSTLITSIQRDFPEFWLLPVEIAGQKYPNTLFDGANAWMIFDRLTESSDDDDLALVLPQDATTIPMLVIESLVALFKYDLLNGNANALHSIAENDPVGFMLGRISSPGQYLGYKQDFDGNWRHSVKVKDVIYKVQKAQEYRIRPFNPSDSKKRREAAPVMGQVLEELIQAPPGGIMAFQKSKMLLVTPNKLALREALKTIEIGGDPVSGVFPIADYTSASEPPTPLIYDPMRREPILGLVSALDIAEEIARNDPNIRLILIDGAAKTRNYGAIDRLNSHKYQRKIISLLRTEDEDELVTLKKMGFDAWIWHRKDLQRLKSQGSFIQLSGTKPVASHTKLINALADHNPSFVVPILPALTTEAVTTAWKSLSKISRITAPDDTAASLIRGAYALLKALQQLPVSISQHDEYLRKHPLEYDVSFGEKIKVLRSEVSRSIGVALPESSAGAWDQVLQGIDLLAAALSTSNPKRDQLIFLLQGHQSGAVVICGREDFVGALKEALPVTLRTDIEIARRAEDAPGRKVIYTGWFNRQFGAFTFLAPYSDITYLVYEMEKQTYDRLYASHPASPDTHFDTTIRAANPIVPLVPQLDEVMPVAASIPSPVEDEPPLDLDELRHAIDTRFGVPTGFEGVNDWQVKERIDAIRINFEDESFAYFGSHQDLYRLDRNSHETKHIKVKDLCIGDEVVFASSSRDLFDDLIASLADSDEYSGLRSIVEIWRTALRRWMGENHLDETQVSVNLREFDCFRGPDAINNWLNKPGMIGPFEDNYAPIRAIAAMTKDTELSNRLEEVIGACKKVNSIHNQTGRLLVRQIANAAAIDEESELDDDIKRRVATYARNTRIATVSSIADSPVAVPVQYVGRLLVP